MECSWNSPLRPTTPVTVPESDAGICGAAVLTSARAWFGDCTVSIGVPKAAVTWATDPLTGSRFEPAWGVPTVRPSPRRTDVACATSSALGPNSAAYCAAVRYWRYCGDPGVLTAATAAASPGGILTGEGDVEVEDLRRRRGTECSGVRRDLRCGLGQDHLRPGPVRPAAGGRTGCAATAGASASAPSTTAPSAAPTTALRLR